MIEDKWASISVGCAIVICLATSCDSVPRGVAGESCTARNDCRSDLACIRNVCQRASTGLSATGRTCYRIECGADADCCDAFVPDPSCDFYMEACNMDPADCASFRLLCVCNEMCVDELCRTQGPGCAADTECPAFSSPYCVAERCVECREHGDCRETERCVDGQCTGGCTVDEECPLLHGCDAGTCVEAGCSSDRECAFVLGDGRARCVDAACVVSCRDDAECDIARFEVCHGGECIFAGCESDAECRAYLGLAATSDGARAVCR